MRVLAFAAAALLTFGVASATSAQQPAADGKVLFEQNCKSCHGVRGIPAQAMVKMMNVPRLDAGYFAKHSDDSIVVVLKKGRGANMKSFAGKLTPDQMVSIARYIRDLATTPAGK
jgi:mono/diheme cytochrome c family protein